MTQFSARSLMAQNGTWSNRLLRFEPVLKERIWGGRRLAQLFGKAAAPERRIGESWELFAFAGDSVRVSAGGGGGDGAPLAELIRRRCVPVDDHSVQTGSFPLLFKWIDAAEDLSVQVHPPDGHPLVPAGHRGKTECWAVVSAEPGASLYVGLKPGVKPEEVADGVRTGQVAELLQRYPAVPGEVFFVPAGTVHAIGRGVTLAEIQQASDVTFRLYDWDRIDPSTGVRRPLHVEPALACLADHPAAGRVTPRCTLRADAVVVEQLVSASCCHAFVLDRVTVRCRVQGTIPRPWSVWMVTEGRAVVAIRDRKEWLRPGDTVLVLGEAELQIEPIASPLVLLETRLPNTGSTAWLG